jgi:hypothetical protein
MCAIMTCDAGWVEIGSDYATGCNCKDDSWGKTCATITNAGSVGIPGTITETGVLPLAGEENWFEVDFVDYTATNFNGAITISPSSEFLFNVYTASCASTLLACGDEGTTSKGLASWGMTETDTMTPISTFPPAGTAGVVYIEVYRASATPTCDTYTLTITD